MQGGSLVLTHSEADARVNLNQDLMGEPVFSKFGYLTSVYWTLTCTGGKKNEAETDSARSSGCYSS